MNEDAATALVRALRTRLDGFGADLEIENLVSRSWASVTFTGARHSVSLRLEGHRAGQAADAFLDGMDEAEFDLRDHILADIVLVRQVRDEASVRLFLQALTVEKS
jgi:hypothetical protein